MTHPNAKLDALIARIKADVQVRKSGSRTVVETNKTREARAKRERGDDPALRALMRASNVVVFQAKPDPYKHFHEVGRLSVLQKQICRCCDEVQVNVVAEMIHLRGRTAADTPVVDVWTRRSSVQPLPHEAPMWTDASAVEFCAECIEIGSATSCWSTNVVMIEGSGQIPLIN